MYTFVCRFGVCAGGMKQFEAEFPDLCWSSRKQLEMPGRLLCSPTNDTVEPEIETATASQVLPFLYLGTFSFPPPPTPTSTPIFCMLTIFVMYTAIVRCVVLAAVWHAVESLIIICIIIVKTSSHH